MLSDHNAEEIQRDLLILQEGFHTGAGDVDSLEFRARLSRLLNLAQKLGSLTAPRDSALPLCSSSCDADDVELGQVEVIALSDQTQGPVAQAYKEKVGSMAESPDEQSGTSKMCSSAGGLSESQLNVVWRPCEKVNLPQATTGRSPPHVPSVYARKVNAPQRWGLQDPATSAGTLAPGCAQSVRAHHFAPMIVRSPQTPGCAAQAYTEKFPPSSGCQANRSRSMTCRSAGVLSESKIHTPSRMRTVNVPQHLWLKDPAMGAWTSAVGYAQSVRARSRVLHVQSI